MINHLFVRKDKFYKLLMKLWNHCMTLYKSKLMFNNHKNLHKEKTIFSYDISQHYHVRL